MASRPFWSMHTHSRYSVNDALPMVQEIVDEAEQLHYPALGLTDHGSVAGNLQLYKACRKKGMEPLPGVELYVTPDREAKVQGHNLHMTVTAYTELGYQNLCHLVTATAKNHHYKPRVDLADLAAMSETGATKGLAIATGCWFGLLPTVMREQGPAAAEQLAKTLASWFPRTYIELQAHGIEQNEFGEDEMVEALLALSHRTGIPHVITTDAHYVVPCDQALHNGLKRICSWSDDPDDAIFPGGPYSLLGEADLKMFFDPEVVDSSCESLADLAAAASVRIPAIDQFRMLVPDVAKTDDPMTELRQAAADGFQQNVSPDVSKAKRDRYSQRLNHELDVVEQTGFAPYLLLIALVCQEMRRRKIVFNTRGSANDSLLCWLLGITNVDAVDWKLRFERFISVDRIKPPDVDLDIEHERRDEIIAWAATQFTVCQVGTIMKYSLFDEEGDQGKGSLRVRYFSTARKAGWAVGDWRDIPESDRVMLKRLSDRKLISGYGTHPAGLILAPDAATIADLPMTHVGSGKKAHLVTSYGKDDVEDLGFIKADFLGLKTLTAARIAVELIMADEGIDLTPTEYLETIPLDDAKVYARIGNGRTEGTFQLQEGPATDFVRRMRPKNIRDVVAAMALFRPAARASGTTGTYLARRKGVERAPDLHPDLEAETKSTHGVLLYQEQVIGALRTLRMDMTELNALLKAVKSSNEYVAGARVAIAAALPRIRELAEARGWGEKDVEIIVDAIVGYGDYGFNEAHAVAYGLLAYRTSWLAEHYPNQWWTGVLTAYSNDDKEPQYVRAARRYGVRIIPPHVNRSGATYTYDRPHNAVRRGLLSVKGVGDVAAAELADKQPFESLADLGKRCQAKRVSGAKGLALGKPIAECGGVVAALNEAGALDDLE